MNNEILKAFIKFPISRKARNRVKEYLYEKSIRDLKLIMTLLVKDEENLIEKNIRFHKAMGVDGFIITSHNSTDGTNEILERLKKEGLVQEIIYIKEPHLDQAKFVNRMIKIAKHKYKADWIINSDADEFYYSKDLNLKKSILKYKKTNVNVLWADSTFLFPDNRDDFLSCPYFVTKPFLEYEAEKLDIKDKEEFKEFIGSQGCTKVIHKAKGYKRIIVGNHDVKMINKVSVQTPEISLYHFNTKNYNELVKKVKRNIERMKTTPFGQSMHIKKIIEEYESGKLKQDYDSKYNENMRKFLIEQGVVTIDKSVSNFLQLISDKKLI